MYKKKVKKSNDPNTLIKVSVKKVEKPKPVKVKEKGNTKSFLWKRSEAVLNLLKDSYNVIKFNKPLIVGISKVLQEKHPVIPNRLINTAMYIHTRSKPYLINLTKNTNRFDLNNQPSETVNAESASNAKILLTQLYKAARHDKARPASRSGRSDNKERVRRR